MRLMLAGGAPLSKEVHEFMRVMDDVFGYGKVDDPATIKKWWRYGPPKGKIYGTRT